MSVNFPPRPDSKNNEQSEEPPVLNRRHFLKWTLAGAGGLLVAPELVHAAFLNERYLYFYNPNTSETVRRVYWTPREGYIRESINEVSWALRDHHNNEVRQFDPGVLDQLYALQLQLGLSRPINVISGYRSPTTNWALRETSRRVARKSYHMEAMAMDIRLPGGRISDLYRAARSLGAGGVGYYPRRNFIHIDSGPVRYWS